MDLLLPVFQLLYFVVHFLSSLALSVIETSRDLHNLLLYLYHLLHSKHRPISALNHLEKVPQHMVLVTGYTDNVGKLADVLTWAGEVGISYVTLYTPRGIIEVLRLFQAMQKRAIKQDFILVMKESSEQVTADNKNSVSHGHNTEQVKKLLLSTSQLCKKKYSTTNLTDTSRTSQRADTMDVTSHDVAGDASQHTNNSDVTEQGVSSCTKNNTTSCYTRNRFRNIPDAGMTVTSTRYDKVNNINSAEITTGYRNDTHNFMYTEATQVTNSNCCPKVSMVNRENLSSIPAGTNTVVVNVLSSVDGRGNLVNVAKDLAKQNCSTRKNCEREQEQPITAEMISNSLIVASQPDPELVGVLDVQPLSTLGLLPWHIRLSEIYSLPSLSRLHFRDFMNILERYSKVEQRFGQ